MTYFPTRVPGGSDTRTYFLPSFSTMVGCSFDGTERASQQEDKLPEAGAFAEALTSCPPPGLEFTSAVRGLS